MQINKGIFYFKSNIYLSMEMTIATRINAYVEYICAFIIFDLFFSTFIRFCIENKSCSLFRRKIRRNNQTFLSIAWGLFFVV